MSNYFAQTEALMHGKTAEKVRLNLINKDLMRESKISIAFKVLQEQPTIPSY
jgi:hypothetical protein